VASNRKDQIRVVQFFRREYKVVVAVARSSPDDRAIHYYQHMPMGKVLTVCLCVTLYGYGFLPFLGTLIHQKPKIGRIRER